MPTRFLNNIKINDSYTMPAADGTADQVVSTDGAGQLSFIDQTTLSAESAEVVKVPVKNLQGSALTKGDPVYISGSVGTSGRLEVKLADAGNTAKMPALGLLAQDLAINGEGYAVVTGKLRNLATSPIDGATPSEGDVVYVKSGGTTGAALTTTKPTGVNLIQNMGKVGRVSTANDGTFVVSSILRSNDVPTPIYIDHALQRVGINEQTPAEKLVVSETRTGSTPTDLYTTVVKSVQSAGATPNPGTGGLKVQYNDGTNDHGFGLVAGTTSSDFLTSGPMHFYTNSDLDTKSATGLAMILDTGQNLGIGVTSITAGNRLEVAGGTIGIDDYLVHNGDTTTKFGFVANSNFVINTAGVERVRVTSGGSVGIATNNPGAKLDVEGNAVIGSPLNTATGTWAVAIGNDNTASGLDALATGELTTASGRQSFSGGFDTTASGDASFAVGGGTTASAENAFAACGTTVASGISSAAFGAFSEATATNSFAINGDTTASGESSFSLGVSTNARALASIASGQSCNTGLSANGAFAGGTVSNANGQFSIAYGDVANASGRVSQALGYIVNATGQYSFAQGFNNTASGTAAAAFGQQNTSSGSAAWSLTTGFLNTTRDSASLTVGSHNGMTASSASREQFMLGRYLNVPRNSSGTPSAGCLVVGQHNAYLNRPNVKFAVGTGPGVGAEQDSFTVLQDGNVLMEQIVNKNYSSDSAAASGGVPVGGIYHNAGDLKIRLT